MLGRRAFCGVIAGVIATLLLTIGVSGAGAATTFGADLTQATHTGAQDSCGAADCSFIGLLTTTGVPEPPAPISGVLTSVRVRTMGGAAPNLVVRVLRDTGTTNSYRNVGPEIPVPVPAIATVGGAVTEATGVHHPIQAGDHLGIGYTTPAPFFYMSAASAMSACSFLNGSHPVETNATYFPAGCMLEPLVAATVEPDADHDGYGDETQDQCPTDASTQGPCPASSTPTPVPPPVPHKKCKKKHHAAAVAKKCKKHRR
jgi:hypothetical protein